MNGIVQNATVAVRLTVIMNRRRTAVGNDNGKHRGQKNPSIKSLFSLKTPVPCLHHKERSDCSGVFRTPKTVSGI